VNDYVERPGFLARTLSLALAMLMLLPPALWAQSIGSPTSPLLGLTGNLPLPMNPDIPVVTHPNALQPINPVQTPCPVTAPAPSTMREKWPPRAGEDRQNWEDHQDGDRRDQFRQDRDQRDGGRQNRYRPDDDRRDRDREDRDREDRDRQDRLSDMSPNMANSSTPGLLNPMIQEQGERGRSTFRAPNYSLTQPPSQGVGQLSIEEGFSRFFVLQGVTGQLKQFGYNFFEQPFSGTSSVMDMPVGPDYVLGPDDTLALHIWNAPQSSFNRSYIMPVERDGMMVIPQVGAVPVVGNTMAQAQRLIHARLSNLLKHFDMHLSIARLRTIKVYAVGEVVRPGAYEVSSLATVSHALYASCGPAKSGSLRHIQVVRDGKVFGELDFYQFFIQGDRSHDLRLQSGDTIVVPPIGPVAAIGGPVKRPAIYELRGQTGLHALLDLAGGVSPTADRKRGQIYRVEAGLQRVILDIDLGGLGKDSQDPLIADGDFVRIAAVPTQIENAVMLAGAVRNPGPFEFRPGMRLKDLLTPDQLLIDSYMDRAELVRTDPVTYDVLVRPFSPRALFQGKEENVELRRLDKVMVATQVKRPGIARVSGEVKRPGLYTIEQGERLSSVLKRTGGFTPRAFPQGLVLIRESVRKAQNIQIAKFVALQKQKMVMEAASLSSGSVSPQGGGQEQMALQLQMQALDQMADRLQPGRVVVRMDSIEQLEQSAEDVTLEEGDSITIPVRAQTVSIIGAVKNPTSVVAYEGLRVEDYLRQAGGVTSDADDKELYILRANGETEAAYVRLKDVRVGDTIVVPQLVEAKTRPLPFWQSIASIVGSVMLGVAAISIIGK
jgi:polysaccharide biosynthesis/export protein